MDKSCNNCKYCVRKVLYAYDAFTETKNCWALPACVDIKHRDIAWGPCSLYIEGNPLRECTISEIDKNVDAGEITKLSFHAYYKINVSPMQVRFKSGKIPTIIDLGPFDWHTSYGELKPKPNTEYVLDFVYHRVRWEER